MADEEDPKPKQVYWIGTCRTDLRDFPTEVKKEVGTALTAVQWGRDHPSVKVMQGFGGAAVREVRADHETGTYRVVFTVKPKAIYGLHAFQKKSKSGRKTPKEDMDRVKRRLAAAEADYETRFG